VEHSDYACPIAEGLRGAGEFAAIAPLFVAVSGTPPARGAD
jgi:hypothetical protein